MNYIPKSDEYLAIESYDVQEFFDLSRANDLEPVLLSSHFERKRWQFTDESTLILDRFPDAEGASCCFFRSTATQTRTVRFVIRGGYQLLSCSSGGWIVQSTEPSVSSYWIPQAPVLRTLDSFERILSEEPAPIVGIKTSADELVVEVKIPGSKQLDVTIWCFDTAHANILQELEQPLVLEKQSIFFWTSQTTYQTPADVYLYLVHGHVYTNRFIWPRKWKICSELDAYGIYITLSGLERATDKKIYDLLKRQIIISIIARQSEDGGWYHGEWTDLMESHYRFHNGAMLLLEAASREYSDEIITKVLARAAYFISQRTDKTDLGLWFLHDSLEESADMMRELCKQTGATWIPSRILGKSPTNKLILNTHLDTIITLEQYRQVTADNQYAEEVNSALDAARSLLALRPAEMLYRLIYSAINLILLPTQKAVKLPLPIRAFKRLTWKYIIPQLYSRIKLIYPRLVMPNGFIERHLSMPHYDINYHPVNIMDLARLWRCFPDEDLADLLNNAVDAVTKSSILEYWADSKPRYFSLVQWVDALYHLCILRQDASYRQFLAEGIIKIEDMELGLPPSLFGADPEAVNITQRIPCPSATNPHLRIANLSCGDHIELLVINATSSALQLTWERDLNYKLSWTEANNQSLISGNSQLSVPARSWLWGKGI